MGILIDALFRVAQPNLRQQRQHLRFTLCGAALLMQTQDFAHLRADGFYRIQGVARILRHQTNPRAAKAVEAFGGPAADLFAVNRDAPAVTARVIGQQANNRLRGGGFTRTGFADERQHFAAFYRKTDVVHHFAPFALRTIADAQILDGQNIHGRSPLN